MDKRVCWVWLVMIFGPASSRIWELGAKSSDASEFCRALRKGDVPGLSEYEKRRAASIGFEGAEKIIGDCESSGIRVLSYGCSDYPERLREIANPPAVLFVRGDLGLLRDRFVICIAGSRQPSDYSQKLTTFFARTLGDKGCVIASGLSAGTDILAYNIASDCGSPTLGIYGLAIDKLSQEEQAVPTDNSLLISEMHSEIYSQRPRFSGRNRLITALCDAVVFVEGSLKSRGLDLCISCIQQGRLLFVVPPHDITDPRYMGQAWLLRHGCKPVFSETDIMYELSGMGVDRIRYGSWSAENSETDDYSFFTDQIPRNKKGKSSSAPKVKEQSRETPKAEMPEADLSGLSEKEKEILTVLRDGTMLADEISSRIGQGIADTLSMLTMLELEGYVLSLPGKRFGLQ